MTQPFLKKDFDFLSVNESKTKSVFHRIDQNSETNMWGGGIRNGAEVVESRHKGFPRKMCMQGVDAKGEGVSRAEEGTEVETLATEVCSL